MICKNRMSVDRLVAVFGAKGLTGSNGSGRMTWKSVGPHSVWTVHGLNALDAVELVRIRTPGSPETSRLGRYIFVESEVSLF